MIRLLAVFLSLAASLPAQPAKETPFLEWKPVVGAGGYVVQVRDAAGKIVVDKRVQQNRVDVDLPAGKYQQRVAVLNKFQKPAGYSEWLDLDIRIAAPATVQEIKAAPLSAEAEKKGERAVAIQGDNFNRETKVFVETGAGKVEATRVDVQSDTRLVASFDAQKLDPGKHDILLENPRNRVTRIEDAVKVGEDKRIVATGRIESDTGKDPRKDPGRDPGKEPGKEPGKQEPGPAPTFRPLYPEYKETDRKCGRAGICLPGGERYTWNMQISAFVPGLTQIRAGDKKGYAWIGVMGAVLGGAYAEDRKADKSAALASSSGLAPIFSSPLVLTTYSLWTQPSFLILAGDQFKNQRHLRKDYSNHIRNRNILIGSAVVLYAFQIIDAAIAGSGQKFHFRNPTGTGPMPMQTNLANSSFTWKFNRDVWVPGRVRMRDNSFYGKFTVGALLALGGAFVYDTYESNRLIGAAVDLRESPLNKAVTTFIAPFTSPYWTNPSFVYAVGENNRQYQSLRSQFRDARQRQILYAGTALALYFASVFDAATYTSTPRFFEPAQVAPGSNPLPMADMYCSGGPCMYSPAVDPAFKFSAASLVPGRVRKLQGYSKTGNILLGTTIGALVVAGYNHYQAEQTASAARRLNSSGLNTLFSNSAAFIGTSSYWTDTGYVLLFSDYYSQLRGYSRSYENSQQTRNVALGVAGAIYLIQFLDAGALNARSAATPPPAPAPLSMPAAVEPEKENAFYAAQGRTMYAEKQALDARLEYSAEF
jgi:hypothetical protein